MARAVERKPRKFTTFRVYFRARPGYEIEIGDYADYPAAALVAEREREKCEGEARVVIYRVEITEAEVLAGR